MNNHEGIGFQLSKLESMISDIYDSLDIDKRVCPICNRELTVYLPFGTTNRKNALCPHCYSLDRERTIWLYFRDKIKLFSEKKEIKILHFAPEKSLKKQFSNMQNVDYYPVDFDPTFRGIREIVDIQNIKYDDDIFDIIICNHVLEHIPDEEKALSELHRVLKKDGIIYLTVPINYDLIHTLENPEYCTPELRREHYGQEDHLRMYGMDFHKRLKGSGFIAKILLPNSNLSDKELSYWGLARNEQIFQCTINK